jgi:hypothetical protein
MMTRKNRGDRKATANTKARKHENTKQTAVKQQPIEK